MQLIGMLDSSPVRRFAAAIRDLGSRSERGYWPALRNSEALRASSAADLAATALSGDRAVLTDVTPARRRDWRWSADAPVSLPPARVGSEVPASVAGTILLHDGRRVTLGPLTEGSRARFQRFVRELSPRSRAMRFHAGFREAPESLLRELLRTDRYPNVAWVAQEYGCDGPIVAEARFVAADGEGEIALAVADGWQRQGLGRALLLQLLRHAESSGIHRVHAFVRRDNEPMLQLAISAGFELHTLPDDPTLAVAERRLEAKAGRGRSAGPGPLLRSGDGAVPVRAASRATHVVRLIRAFGLPTLAAIVLPGGFLVAVVAGLTRLRSRRSMPPVAVRRLP